MKSISVENLEKEDRSRITIVDVRPSDQFKKEEPFPDR